MDKKIALADLSARAIFISSGHIGHLITLVSLSNYLHYSMPVPEFDQSLFAVLSRDSGSSEKAMQGGMAWFLTQRLKIIWSRQQALPTT